MASKNKQDVLMFPVRKSRTSSRCKKLQRETSTTGQMPQSSSLGKCGGRNNLIEAISSPRKKRLQSKLDASENACSPPKKSCITPEKDMVELNSTVSLPVVKLSRSPLKSIIQNAGIEGIHVSSSQNETLLTPKQKDNITPTRNNHIPTPTQYKTSTQERKCKTQILESPVIKSTKLYFEENSQNYEQPLQQSPHKLHSGILENLVLPIKRSPRKLINSLICDSPVRKSPRKLQFANSLNTESQINISSMEMNLTKLTDSESPVRKSPRKMKSTVSLDFDYSSSRKSPRKLNILNSPSNLMSRLSVSSPKTFGSMFCLHSHPELAVYQSLKTSFSQNLKSQIVGREIEIKFFKEFLEKNLKNKTPGSLYVSGAPGTGKTASLANIIESIKDVKFQKLFLNCMSSKTSKEIFNSISEYMKLPVKFSEREIISQIEKAVVTSKVPIVLILDEVDRLESKDQKVLYTIFEWPSLLKSRLILIGIANMLDLTDRVLPRLQAHQSCRPQLLHFPPYTKAEIIHIINERIKQADVGETELIKPSAIHFLAGKVSSVAGDIRRALDVCRRAVELCEMEARKQLRLDPMSSILKSPRKNAIPANLPQVDMGKIMAIFNEVYGSRVTAEITNNPNTFPLQQKIVICSFLLMLKHSKTKTVTLGKFHDVYSRVCSRQKLPAVEQSEFFSLCTLLESRGMLQVKKTKELRNSKILLRLNEDEAASALGDKALLISILEDKEALSKNSTAR